VIAPSDRIDLALARTLGKVDRELAERLLLAHLRGRHGAVARTLLRRAFTHHGLERALVGRA
jgi:hypothetical protein